VSQTWAVARYTLVELSRRRLLLLFVVAGVVLIAGVGLAPFVVPGIHTGPERTSFLLDVLPRPAGLAIELCAFAVGMTVINHDLDSGAIVAIFAKPVTRAAYAAGKLGAALFMLLVLDAIFALGAMLDVTLNGGSQAAVVFWYFATTAANFLLLMVLVMILTVYVNSIVAGGVGVAFAYIAGLLADWHGLVVNGVITDRVLSGIITVAYWSVPHSLLSNLAREAHILDFSLHPGPATPAQLAESLARVPGASPPGEVFYWIAYLVVLCSLLYLAVRRKQV
jgi:ABC-type transport system involved in multi-copper enzyme maturation permease subunit